MNKYDVSIIIATYNAEEYLKDCIDSILKQKYDTSKIEIILVNDGSTDNSLAICKEYEKTYSNIIVIDKKNGGVSSARNAGIKKARGRYIMILDSDDFISKRTIKELVSFMDNNDVDIASYSMITYRPDSKRKHYKNQFFTKGTAVYNVEEYPYLSQSTVNIIFKNNFEKNEMYDEKMVFAEDEKYNTALIMKKGKLGYVKEATYFYRKFDNSQASVLRENPLFSYDTTIKYYQDLFHKYEKNNKIPKYIQGVFLNCLRYRIMSGYLLPYHKIDPKEYENSVNELKELIKKLDPEIIIEHPQLDRYHKFYLINFVQKNVKIEYKEESFIIKYENKILENSKRIALCLNRFKIKDNKLRILGYIRSIILLYKEPTLYLVSKSKDGKKSRKKLLTFDSNYKYYKSKLETAKAYGFETEIDISNVIELYFEVEIDKNIFTCNYEFSLFTPFHKKLRIKSYATEKKAIFFNNHSFIIKNKNFLTATLANAIRYGIILLKRPQAFVDRIKAKKIKKEKVWLYCDRVGIYDNAYYQFKHDIEKNDGIKRYYIIDEDIESKKDLFTKKEIKENVIKKNSRKNIQLHLAADKIITSFSSISEYSPYNLKSFKFYNDITNYQLVYLQHGVLYANLIKMYSKEYTEIEKIIISSEFEKNNLINNYKYSEKDLIFTGMPRFENNNEKIEKKKKILLAPSWRSYLIQDPPVNGKRKALETEFKNSKFYKEINNIINDVELNKKLKEKKITLDIKLHPIFSVYNNCFAPKLSNIKLQTEKIVEAEYSLFITDFSSYQFDFAQIETPIIYFIPDEVEFAAGLHTYRKLDLELKDAFGDIAKNSKELSKYIEEYISNGFKVKDKYKKRMNSFFIKNKNIKSQIYESLKKNN